MFTTADVGRLKVDAMRDRIHAMNPDVNVQVIPEFITRDNIEGALKGCDYVIEASDNFATKFLVNDACVHHGIAFTIAGVVKFTGQILSVRPGSTPCYRCLFAGPAPDDGSNSCAAVGVIGTNPTLAGTLQANEAIKSVLGLESRFAGEMLLFDLLDDTFEWISLKRNPSCKACSDPSIPYYKTASYQSGDDSCTT